IIYIKQIIKVRKNSEFNDEDLDIDYNFDDDEKAQHFTHSNLIHLEEKSTICQPSNRLIENTPTESQEFKLFSPVKECKIKKYKFTDENNTNFSTKPIKKDQGKLSKKFSKFTIPDI
ncbi:MAG: hypothetical protein MHPSP_004706, partial [Paramarteilia canceri]